jgi:hypothetical protein
MTRIALNLTKIHHNILDTTFGGQQAPIMAPLKDLYTYFFNFYEVNNITESFAQISTTQKIFQLK